MQKQGPLDNERPGKVSILCREESGDLLGQEG